MFEMNEKYEFLLTVFETGKATIKTRKISLFRGISRLLH